MNYGGIGGEDKAYNIIHSINYILIQIKIQFIKIWKIIQDLN